MDGRGTRAQKAMSNTGSAKQGTPPIAAAHPLTPSATPPAAAPQYAPSPSISNSYSAAPAPTPRYGNHIGIINIPSLTSMTAVLAQSNNPLDKDLFTWTQDTFFTPPVQPHEEGRPVASSEGFYKLLDVYKRVRTLTNSTVPAKWPFFTGDYRKEMSMKEVRKNAGAVKGMKRTSGEYLDLWKI